MSATTVDAAPAVDFAAIKARTHAAWSSGDYAAVGTTLQIVGESLCEALDVRAGQRVLDVAAGNGNASLAAARRGCDVLATDYVPALLDRAAERAAAERLPLAIRVADAEELPFQNASFDAVLSTFGVMFTPNQPQSASELLRVCRAGGKIGMANWTPQGFIGQLFRTIGAHVPPAPGVMSPARWGTPEFIREQFEPHAAAIEMQERHFVFRYRSAEHFLGVFRAVYGPTLKAFAALDEAGKEKLAGDIISLVGRFNRSGDGTMVVPSEYLEVVVTKR